MCITHRHYFLYRTNKSSLEEENVLESAWGITHNQWACGPWNNNRIALNEQMGIKDKTKDLFWWLLNPEPRNGTENNKCCQDERNLFPTTSPTKFTARGGRAWIVNARVQVSSGQTCTDYVFIAVLWGSARQQSIYLNVFYLWLSRGPPSLTHAKVAQMLRLMRLHVCPEGDGKLYYSHKEDVWGEQVPRPFRNGLSHARGKRLWVLLWLGVGPGGAVSGFALRELSSSTHFLVGLLAQGQAKGDEGG